MDIQTYEVLKDRITKEKELMAQNKGRLSQLKETAKKNYGVDTVAGLKKLKTKLEENLEMEQTKKNIQMKQLEDLIPKDVMDEIRDSE